MKNFGRIAPRDQERMSHNVIACNKRKAFVQGMDCFAETVIGRRFAPTRWFAMTGIGRSVLDTPHARGTTKSSSRTGSTPTLPTRCG